MTTNPPRAAAGSARGGATAGRDDEGARHANGEPAGRDRGRARQDRSDTGRHEPDDSEDQRDPGADQPALAQTDETLAQTSDTLTQTNQTLAETDQTLAETQTTLARTNDLLDQADQFVASAQEAVASFKKRVDTLPGRTSQLREQAGRFAATIQSAGSALEQRMPRRGETPLQSSRRSPTSGSRQRAPHPTRRAPHPTRRAGRSACAAHQRGSSGCRCPSGAGRSAPGANQAVPRRSRALCQVKPESASRLREGAAPSAALGRRGRKQTILRSAEIHELAREPVRESRTRACGRSTSYGSGSCCTRIERVPDVTLRPSFGEEPQDVELALGELGGLARSADRPAHDHLRLLETPAEDPRIDASLDDAARLREELTSFIGSLESSPNRCEREEALGHRKGVLPGAHSLQSLREHPIGLVELASVGEHAAQDHLRQGEVAEAGESPRLGDLEGGERVSLCQVGLALGQGDGREHGSGVGGSSRYSSSGASSAACSTSGLASRGSSAK